MVREESLWNDFQILGFWIKKIIMEFLEVEGERISPIDIVEEYNQYTQPASIADTYVVPDMVDGFLW